MAIRSHLLALSIFAVMGCASEDREPLPVAGVIKPPTREQRVVLQSLGLMETDGQPGAFLTFDLREDDHWVQVQIWDNGDWALDFPFRTVNKEDADTPLVFDYADHAPNIQGEVSVLMSEDEIARLHEVGNRFGINFSTMNDVARNASGEPVSLVQSYVAIVTPISKEKLRDFVLTVFKDVYLADTSAGFDIEIALGGTP